MSDSCALHKIEMGTLLTELNNFMFSEDVKRKALGARGTKFKDQVNRLMRE
jgi:hypothetical protein